MTYNQLTLMPYLDGAVMMYKGCTKDPAVMLALTSIHDRHYQFDSHDSTRFYFNTETGLSTTQTPYA